MSQQADFIEAMKALGHDADAILEVISKVDEIKLERKREKTRNRVRRHRDWNRQDVGGGGQPDTVRNQLWVN